MSAGLALRTTPQRTGAGRSRGGRNIKRFEGRECLDNEEDIEKWQQEWMEKEEGKKEEWVEEQKWNMSIEAVLLLSLKSRRG